MSRRPRRSPTPGRVTAKGTAAPRPRAAATDASRRPAPSHRGSDGRIHAPRKGFVPPTTNRTGYRGNR